MNIKHIRMVAYRIEEDGNGSDIEVMSPDEAGLDFTTLRSQPVPTPRVRRSAYGTTQGPP